MKKLLLSAAMLSLGYGTFAQGLELGLNTTIATTWLMNKNVFDQDKRLNPAFSGGWGGGIAASYYFNESIGLGLELNMFGANQKYDGDYGGGFTFEAKDHVSYFEIPILFKLQSEGGFYFEVGPKFGMVTKATEDYTPSGGGGFIDSYSDVDVKAGFKTVTSIVFGFGGKFDLIKDKLFLGVGLRLAGSPGDATVKYTESEADAHKNANDANFGDLGYADGYAHIPSSGAQYAFDADGNAINYKKTHLVSGGIQISITYKLFGEK